MFFNYSQISRCCWPESKRWRRFFLPPTVTTSTPRWTFQLQFCSAWSFSTFSNLPPLLPSGDHEVPAWRFYTGKTVVVVVRFVWKTQLDLGLFFTVAWKPQKDLALLLWPCCCGHQEASVLCRWDRAETSGHGMKNVPPVRIWQAGCL